ncbi:hypothetical protein BN11_1980007 [Nostocoides australiense Ben110]|uniref:Uncharacterized protein n=1 Tax=Nostocoides australiense Ben110 TaxID=1193182 RepID=W6JVU0_9MICO|nr:hypothetical protein BN11_1980007 [Tetrasphaera australiensis Ben110]
MTAANAPTAWAARIRARGCEAGLHGMDDAPEKLRRPMADGGRFGGPNAVCAVQRTEPDSHPSHPSRPRRPFKPVEGPGQRMTRMFFRRSHARMAPRSPPPNESITNGRKRGKKTGALMLTSAPPPYRPATAGTTRRLAPTPRRLIGGASDATSSTLFSLSIRLGKSRHAQGLTGRPENNMAELYHEWEARDTTLRWQSWPSPVHSPSSPVAAPASVPPRRPDSPQPASTSSSPAAASSP